MKRGNLNLSNITVVLVLIVFVLVCVLLYKQSSNKENFTTTPASMSPLQMELETRNNLFKQIINIIDDRPISTFINNLEGRIAQIMETIEDTFYSDYKISTLKPICDELGVFQRRIINLCNNLNNAECTEINNNNQRIVQFIEVVNQRYETILESRNPIDPLPSTSQIIPLPTTSQNPQTLPVPPMSPVPPMPPVQPMPPVPPQNVNRLSTNEVSNASINNKLDQIIQMLSPSMPPAPPMPPVPPLPAVPPMPPVPPVPT